MHFEYSEKVQDLLARLQAFMAEHVYPAEATYYQQLQEDRWGEPPIMEALKQKARDAGLWNLFLPDEKYGAGLNNLEYAPLAEEMGRAIFASEVFNCSAPDTGNMEVLAQYGSEQQKKQWMEPLLRGEIRSAFAMTEPRVASSDATNIETSIVRDGDDYVINGHKFYISGLMNKRCDIMIVMGKTDPDNPNRHQQQSQILVPTKTPGVKIQRPMTVFGYDDAPEGHAEVVFSNVRVPAENLILGEGRGFEIAQGRLGPGRIHHCMRLIGQAQRALEMMAARAEQRTVFGRPMSKQGSVREDIAKSACEIEQARLLTLKAADKMDRHGNKAARDLIAMIKIVAPQMACTVIDRAIQIHGAAGLGQDFHLAQAYSYARTIRLADGPDQVHMMQLGRNLAAYFDTLEKAEA
ncbi:MULTISPECIES: acyl-CoA dehydrogenase family protein [Microbulbifer]|uniref:Acyl-CoA dehydrogenase family protein n=1 Tax=Microbulbifer celer TaxID=435905 RepID=A0ABW3UBI7_9GAMM|nr:MULTISPECIES: acyl-CoA dehydrogenase family protein [Microbulbifer]UFN55772.1 acyl-CoA dehydrogenase family protein [Microbulbifer celer]